MTLFDDVDWGVGDDSLATGHITKKEKKKMMKKIKKDKARGHKSNQTLEEMKHSKRYQKSRKIKQLAKKNAMQQERNKESDAGQQKKAIEQKGNEKSEVVEKNKAMKQEGSKESVAVQQKVTVITKESIEERKQKNKEKKKEKKKKALAATKPVHNGTGNAKKNNTESSQVQSAPSSSKKSKNKYKHLAENSTKSSNQSNGTMGEVSMDIDVVKSPKGGKKRKLDASESVEAVVKKAKLNSGQSASTIASAEIVKSNSNVESVSKTEKKKNNKKAKQSQNTLVSEKSGIEISQDSAHSELESSADKKKKKRQEKKKKQKAKKSQLVSEDSVIEKSQDAAPTELKRSTHTIADSNAKISKQSVTSETPLNRSATPKSNGGSQPLPASKSLSRNKSSKMNKIRSLLAAEKEKALSLPDPLTIPPLPTALVRKIIKKEEKLKEATMTLKQRLDAQVLAGEFRYVNEQLYSSDSAAAMKLFAENPEAYEGYHTGYRAQVSKWEENPVDRVIKYIQTKPQKLVVADFGCGDAKLAQSVPNKVHSFDLVAVNEHVTVADSADVPLEDRSVDIAVFSLSLMGTNFVDFLIEANRVLKLNKGILLVAEVKSRFEKIGKFAKRLEKLGFELIKKDESNKMFVWFEFRKTGEVNAKTAIPEMSLLPCLYKKR